MIRYITTINKPSITLNLMGRKKEYLNSQEVNEDAYVRAYPQHFKKVGEIKGYNVHLAKPLFIPFESDPIKDFVNKEEKRKSEKIEETQAQQVLMEVQIEEIVNDFIEESKEFIESMESMESMEIETPEVKIETEE